MEEKAQVLTDSPLVGVIIPCYNHGQYVAQAIQSILAQTIQNFEIVVVDDGSVDNTAEVARQFTNVRYVYQRNQGLSAARNTGIENSRARYLIFLDADDLLQPRAIEDGLNCFAENPTAVFVSGRHRCVSEAGEPFFTSHPVQIPDSHYLAFLRGNYIGMHATVMYRREIFETVGLFDRTLPACEDYDLYLRIAREYPVARHENIVADYRKHGENMSGNPVLMVKMSTSVLNRQRPFLSDAAHKQAFKKGLHDWREYYTREMLRRLRRTKRSRLPLEVARRATPFLALAPGTLIKIVCGAISSRTRKRLELPLVGDRRSIS